LRGIKTAAFRLCEKHFDVFHATQYAPPGPTSKPFLPLFHDLSHIRYPDAHPADRVRWLEHHLPYAAQAEFIQTVSEFTKSEVQSLLGVDAARISVAYPGIAGEFNPEPSVIDDGVLKQYALTAGRFFLCVATREPRKNFRTIAEAYAKLPRAVQARCPMVWSGQAGWGDLDFSPSAKRLIDGGQIRPLGYIADGALAALYRQTTLFLMPSVYEGFGLPLTEALSCRSPVAASDIPVFREVAGRFARFVEPLDADGWAEVMLQALEPTSRPDIAAIDHWLSRYSWHTNATDTLALYRKLAQSAPSID
jgi:alpha-1,3-rhamnosyl/mannosyltransferase